MTRPAVTWGDGEAALANGLRTALGGRNETYTVGVTVGTTVPADRKALEAATPLVVVTHDAPGVVQARVAHRIPVRVMVWHTTRDDTHDLTVLCHALLCAYRDGTTVRHVEPGPAPFVTRDPDTGEPLGSFTAYAHLVPRAL